MPQPAWYLDEPAIEPCERVYLEAFVDLQTCRTIGMDLGPIPWRDIAAYGDRLLLVGPMHRLFCKVIRAMDEAWLTKRAQDREERDAEKERERERQRAAEAATRAS